MSFIIDLIVKNDMCLPWAVAALQWLSLEGSCPFERLSISGVCRSMQGCPFGRLSLSGAFRCHEVVHLEWLSL